MNTSEKIASLLELKTQILQLSVDDRWTLLKLLVESLQPEILNPPPKSPEDLGWTPGFFERTAGSWQGEPLVRAPQEEASERELS
jgi:hypothetical protein